MKLQTARPGNNGLLEWVDLFVFDAERVHEVEDAAASLARAVGVKRMLIIDDAGEIRPLNANGVFRAGGL